MQFARSLARTRLLVLGATVLIASIGLSGTACAQQKGALEMGYDVGLAIQVNDSHASSFDDGNVASSLQVPASDVVGLTTLRLGYLFSERSELESRFGFGFFGGSGGGESESWTTFGLDYAHHFDNGQHHPFLRAGGRWIAIGHEFGPDISQFGLDAGFGMKSNIGHQLATRVDVGAARFFDTDNRVGHWDVSLAFGISFFTR